MVLHHKKVCLCFDGFIQGDPTFFFSQAKKNFPDGPNSQEIPPGMMFED
jgi:hypothetical protein